MNIDRDKIYTVLTCWKMKFSYGDVYVYLYGICDGKRICVLDEKRGVIEVYLDKIIYYYDGEKEITNKEFNHKFVTEKNQKNWRSLEKNALRNADEGACFRLNYSDLTINKSTYKKFFSKVFR